MAAYEQLYRAHGDALMHRVIRPRVASRQAAEDALVETFAAALEHLPGFRWQGKSIYHWLARIAVNKAHDTSRAAVREGKAREALRAEPQEEAPRPDAMLNAHADRRRARAQVDEILAAIPPRYALALRLRLLEELGREACAARMEVRVATFDVVLLRAVRAFRKAWQERFGVGEAP